MSYELNLGMALLIVSDYFIIRALEDEEIVKNKRGLRGIKRLLMAQFVISLTIALGLLFTRGQMAASSAMLGGLVAIIPSAIFAKKLFQHQGARAARQIVKSFYIGEALKISISVVLFALIFKFFQITPLAFFSTYIVVVFSCWLAPLFFTNNQNRPKSD